MSFESPLLLLGLLLVPVAVGLYVLAQRRRTLYAVRFTNLDLLANLVPRFPGWRRHLPPALFLLAASLLLVALARPQATVLVPREEATVVLVMDTSGSMVATDVRPDRLSAAKSAAETFLDRLPDELRVGLVTFDSQARVLSTPTDDHDAVRETLGALSAGGGTAMGDGLARATGLVRPQEDEGSGRRDDGDVPAAVVLLSDGANTSGETEPRDAASRARELGVPVFTVALGTDTGEVETPGGQTVPVPPDRETLREVAEATGGRSFASTSGADLDRVYRELGSSIGFVEEEREVTALFAAGALALLAVGGVLSTLWFKRIP